MTTKIVHPYVTSSPEIGSGRPIVAGTRTKVATIVAYYRLGFSPEELAREFPHLTLSQIHDTLSYYYEHQADIDRQIDEDSEERLRDVSGA